MAAYLVVNIEVTDPERYAEYIKAAPASIARYGGRYIARAGRTQKLEGSYEPKRFVVLQFDTFERALEWWNCDDYAGPKLLRQASSKTDMILVEGVPPGWEPQ
jgi:uncharacterized protein (DUF1330 family)